MDVFKKNLIIFIQKIINEKKNIAVPEYESEKLIKQAPEYSLGDYSLASYYLAKYGFKGKPEDIAGEIFDAAMSNFGQIKGLFDKIEIKGAYVNFFVNKEKFIYYTIKDVTEAGRDYGKGHQEKPMKVAIDFSSPNIAKPFGVGHLRSTVIGMSLSNIYEFCGHDVIKINYLGDFGTQFGKLITAFCRYNDIDFSEFIKGPINVLYNLYVRIHKDEQTDKTLEEDAKSRFKMLEDFISKNKRRFEDYLGNLKNTGNAGYAETENIEWKEIKLSEKNKNAFCETPSGQYDLWRLFRGLSIDEFRRIYKSMGIEFDVYEGEAQSAEFADETVQILLKSKLAIESEGAVIIPLKDVKTPALIAKSDGTSLYLSRDIVTAISRMAKYNYDKMIYVVGSEQALHFSQLFGIFSILKYNIDKIKDNPNFRNYASMIDGRLVHVKFGRIIGMSTRKGNLVFLEDYIGEAKAKAMEKIVGVAGDGKLRLNMPDTADANTSYYAGDIEDAALKIGLGAVIFNDLKTRRTTDVNFNWDNVLSFEGQTGPYLQYTVARIGSLIDKFGGLPEKPAGTDGGEFGIRKEDEDFNDAYNIIKQISFFEDNISDALNSDEPSVISTYILELASFFNKYYQNYRLMGRSEDYAAPRLYMLAAVKTVLTNALNLLCIPVIDRM
ncbi:MAG: arginine--tRNA ligase [bacterium]